MHVKYKIPWSLRSHRYTLNEINLVKNFLKSDKPLINGEYLNKFEKNLKVDIKNPKHF